MAYSERNSNAGHPACLRPPMCFDGGTLMVRYLLCMTAVSTFACSALAEQATPDQDQRLQTLEQRLDRLEAAPPSAGAPASPSSFNPAISLILSGIYTTLARDPADYRFSGFALPGDAEIGPGARGFSLAETELGIYGNIDPYFYGGLNFSLHGDDSASVEEAFIQTIALSNGVTAKAGRFFSSIGYLNAQHAHTWDFVDAPLAYQAMLATQYADDGVWKYAPNGNPVYTNFKLQGEYLQRQEDGEFTYDADGALGGTATSTYDAKQSGWYVQGVYQFMPYWRVGLRTERLDTGTVDYGANAANFAASDFNPSKNSVMIDYSPSEFSRIRLQLAQDKSRAGVTDDQLFVQYQMCLGTHGAHQY